MAATYHNFSQPCCRSAVIKFAAQATLSLSPPINGSSLFPFLGTVYEASAKSISMLSYRFFVFLIFLLTARE